jgi:hypothetical protein
MFHAGHWSVRLVFVHRRGAINMKSLSRLTAEDLKQIVEEAVEKKL